jgi:hypothetical protein
MLKEIKCFPKKGVELRTFDGKVVSNRRGASKRRNARNSRDVSNCRELAIAGTPAIGTPYLATTSYNLYLQFKLDCHYM